MTQARRAAAHVAMLVFFVLFAGMAAQTAIAQSREAQTVILDTIGSWRMHSQLRPPILALDAGPRPILYNQPWLDRDTEAAPKDWAAREFDDGPWVRGVAIRACRTPYLARLCLRGKFEVTDPAQVKGLAVTVGYHGGAAVYLNGKELTRSHLPAGPVTDETLAEAYSEEAFVGPDGELLGRGKGGPEVSRRLTLRDRSIDHLSIPSDALHKGINVLAIEIVRAPYHKLHEDKKVGGDKGQYLLMWNTCEITRSQLTAASSEGLVPNVTRPTGLQAWNSDLFNSDYDLDWGDRNEAVQPVRIVGARNGTFCGKFVVGCDKPIRSLKAAAGELKGDGGTIPSSAVHLRYALPWGWEYQCVPYCSEVIPYPKPAQLLSLLAESPPAEANVVRKPAGPQQGYVRTPDQPEPVYSAVVPVWVSISVPTGTKPGKYVGHVRVEASGEKPLAIPVEVTVSDWSLPDTQDYKT